MYCQHCDVSFNIRYKGHKDSKHRIVCNNISRCQDCTMICYQDWAITDTAMYYTMMLPRLAWAITELMSILQSMKKHHSLHHPLIKKEIKHGEELLFKNFTTSQIAYAWFIT